MGNLVIDGQGRKKDAPMEPLTLRDITATPFIPIAEAEELPQEWRPEQFVDTELDEGGHE